MKSLLKNLAIFLLIAATFSTLTNCSDPQEQVNVGTPPSGTAANNSQPEKKKSAYPPIATAIAQSDVKNLDGSTFKIADKKGKVLLLNLWATWCGPCRAEMPTLVRMQDEHRDRDFEVIGLNTDEETLEQINEFSAQLKLNYTLVWADTKLQQALVNISKFDGIPQSFIVDREGNLRGVFRGANPADIKKMEELVGLIVNE